MNGFVEDGNGDLARAGQSHGECPPVRDRIKEFRRVRARDLVRNPKNWRRHPKAQAAALKGLLSEIGFADALIVRELPDGRLMIIDGHLRADTTPEMEVPVLVLDVTEEEADKLLLTLDPLATLAETDAERIKELIQAVSTDSSAVEDLIRHTAGKDIWLQIHPEELVEGEVALERADELQQKWATESGQLWQAGPHRCICGDSRDLHNLNRLFRDGDRYRLIWTDPPYGVAYGEKTEWLSVNRSGRVRRPIENDGLKPAEVKELFAAALKNSLGCALPGAAIYATVPGQLIKQFIEGLEDGGFAYKHCLVWVKETFVLGRCDYQFRHELILYGWLPNGAHYFVDERTHASVFEVARPKASADHPTCKPIELVAEMIKNSSQPGEIVFDPFAGSGSTLVAAHQLGRTGYGCELDPGYLAVQLERLSSFGLKPELVR